MTYQCPKCSGDLFFFACGAFCPLEHYQCFECHAQFVVENRGTYLEMWETVSPTEIRVTLAAIARKEAPR